MSNILNSTTLSKLEKEGDSQENVKLLLSLVREYTDETLLSWAGYSSKKQWEDDNDFDFSRKELIFYNYYDILENFKILGDA